MLCPMKVKESEVAQSCPTLCDPIDCSLPGSSVHGGLQGGRLGWVAMPFSRGPSWPKNRTLSSYISCLGKWVLYHLGSPLTSYKCNHAIFVILWLVYFIIIFFLRFIGIVTCFRISFLKILTHFNKDGILTMIKSICVGARMLGLKLVLLFWQLCDPEEVTWDSILSL